MGRHDRCLKMGKRLEGFVRAHPGTTIPQLARAFGMTYLAVVHGLVWAYRVFEDDDKKLYFHDWRIEDEKKTCLSGSGTANSEKYRKGRLVLRRGRTSRMNSISSQDSSSGVILMRFSKRIWTIRRRRRSRNITPFMRTTCGCKKRWRMHGQK